MKQTAVDFAVEQLEKLIPSGNQILIGIILEKAKEMEKEQIIDARIDGDENYTLVGNKRKEYAEQYYNETYKINKL
jgi:hypothetical protein